jgi:photosystem II stability/assembly factor-like uncharacterized protein
MKTAKKRQRAIGFEIPAREQSTGRRSGERRRSGGAALRARSNRGFGADGVLRALACLVLVLSGPVHGQSRPSQVDTVRPGAAGEGAVREFPDDLFGAGIGPHGELVVTGYHGAAKVSVDGGRRWKRVDCGTEDLLRRVTVTSDGTAHAVTSGGKILQGDVRDSRWKAVHDEAGLYLRDVAFATPADGWVVGHEGLILHTADSGRSWQRQELKNWTGRDKPRLNGIAAIDAQRAVVVGEFGTVAFTRDGGSTWQLVKTHDLPTLVALAVRGERGLAVGLNGAFVQLELPPRGDVQWSRIANANPRHLLAVSLSEDGRTALIGGRGVLSVYRDGLLSPVSTSVDGALPFTFIGGVAQGPGGETLVVGQAGMILRAGRPDSPYEVVAAAHPEGSYVLPLNTGSAGSPHETSGDGAAGK